MKIYLAHSAKIDYKNELYEPIRKSKLNNAHEFIYFCDDPNYKDKSSKDVILKCDLMIAEISVPSTALGIEIGWANISGIPIILITKDEAQIKGYMHTIAEMILVYKNKIELIEKLTEILDKKL